MTTSTPSFADKTIWSGDNLDILRGMNAGCVDLIYLDPPFNSKRDYAAPVGSAAAGAAFKDTWNLSDLDVAWMGLVADEQPAMYSVLQTAGLSHGKGMQSYLCMMAVRLVEMQRVLRLTGSIYLHCDHTASHYLKLLMDVVFGARNFKNAIIWKRQSAHSDSLRFGMVVDTIHYSIRCIPSFYSLLEVVDVGGFNNLLSVVVFYSSLPCTAAGCGGSSLYSACHRFRCAWWSSWPGLVVRNCPSCGSWRRCVSHCWAVQRVAAVG